MSTLFVVMAHKNYYDSYGGEVGDISADKPGSDTSMSQVEITDTDLDSSVDILQATQWVEVKKFMSTTQHKTSKQSQR
jgi:hypothetical protein